VDQAAKRMTHQEGYRLGLVTYSGHGQRALFECEFSHGSIKAFEMIPWRGLLLQLLQRRLRFLQVGQACRYLSLVLVRSHHVLHLFATVGKLQCVV